VLPKKCRNYFKLLKSERERERAFLAVLRRWWALPRYKRTRPAHGGDNLDKIGRQGSRVEKKLGPPQHQRGQKLKNPGLHLPHAERILDGRVRTGRNDSASGVQKQFVS
jgi:hypothetical protein